MKVMFQATNRVAGLHIALVHIHLITLLTEGIHDQICKIEQITIKGLATLGLVSGLMNVHDVKNK